MYKLVMNERFKKEQHYTVYYYKNVIHAYDKMRITRNEIIEQYDEIKNEHIKIYCLKEHHFTNKTLKSHIHILNGVDDEYKCDFTLTDLGE